MSISLLATVLYPCLYLGIRASQIPKSPQSSYCSNTSSTIYLYLSIQWYLSDICLRVGICIYIYNQVSATQTTLSIYIYPIYIYPMYVRRHLYTFVKPSLHKADNTNNTIYPYLSIHWYPSDICVCLACPRTCVWRSFRRPFFIWMLVRSYWQCHNSPFQYFSADFLICRCRRRSGKAGLDSSKAKGKERKELTKEEERERKGDFS